MLAPITTVAALAEALPKCPPNPDALGQCGHYAGDHPHVAVASDMVTRKCTLADFVAVPGEDLTCPEAVTCDVCGNPVCGEHDDESFPCDTEGRVHGECHRCRDKECYR